MDDKKAAMRKRAMERELRAQGASRKEAKRLAAERFAESLRQRIAELAPWR